MCTVWNVVGKAYVVILRMESKQGLERQLRDLADRMPFMAWLTAPDGGAQFVNAAWCRYTGMSFEDSLGLGWRNVLHPTASNEAVTRWLAAVRQGVPHTTALQYRRTDGTYHLLLSKTWPIKDANGDVAYWLGLAVDGNDTVSDEREKRFLQEVREALAQAKLYIR